MQVGYDLSGRLGPARDQGLRPTCLAFATTSAHEVLHALNEPLSPEWLYYHAVSLAGDPPDAGSKLGTTAVVLAANGQPFDAHWSYQTTASAGTWGPPSVPSQIFRAAGQISAVDVDAICIRLNKDIPSVIALRVDRTFDQWQQVEGEAVLSNAPPPYNNDSAHAVLIVGHGVLSGSRFLKVRNSWGVGWGINGHAWVSEKYVIARAYGAMFLEGV